MLTWVSYTYIIGTEIFQKSDVWINKKLFIIEKLQIKCVLCLLHLVSDFLFHFLNILSFYQWYYTWILHNYLFDYLISLSHVVTTNFVVNKLLYSTCLPWYITLTKLNFIII